MQQPSPSHHSILNRGKSPSVVRDFPENEMFDEARAGHTTGGQADCRYPSSLIS